MRHGRGEEAGRWRGAAGRNLPREAQLPPGGAAASQAGAALAGARDAGGPHHMPWTSTMRCVGAAALVRSATGAGGATGPPTTIAPREQLLSLVSAQQTGSAVREGIDP